MDSYIPWVGGKKALRNEIITLFPADYNSYVEPFAGAGWVFFGKNPDKNEILNDYNSDLTNLHRVVRDKKLALLQELNFFPLHSRTDFSFTKAYLKQDIGEMLQVIASEKEIACCHFQEPELTEIMEILSHQEEAYEVKRAAAFFKLLHYSYGGNGKSPDNHPFDIKRTFAKISLASNRLQKAYIENKDFEAIIDQYGKDKAFFYCDPPYYKTEHYYKGFTIDDHVRLHNALVRLHKSGCFWLLSYNDCPYIRELYKDFYIIEVSRLHNLAQRFDGGVEYPEVIIASYDLNDRKKLKPYQVSFFENYQESGVIVA